VWVRGDEVEEDFDAPGWPPSLPAQRWKCRSEMMQVCDYSSHVSLLRAVMTLVPPPCGITNALHST